MVGELLLFSVSACIPLGAAHVMVITCGGQLGLFIFLGRETERLVSFG